MGDGAQATRLSWDEVWMGVAEVVAKRSACVRRQVGAVIVDSTNRIVATGYNGPPTGMKRSCEIDCPRALGVSTPGPTYDDCISLHAEINALLFCDRRHSELGSIYVTSSICIECAKAISNSGLWHVHFKIFEEDAHRLPEASISIMKTSGLQVWTWD